MLTLQIVDCIFEYLIEGSKISCLYFVLTVFIKTRLGSCHVTFIFEANVKSANGS